MRALIPFSLFLLLTVNTYSQLRLMPIQSSETQKQKKDARQESNLLTLPFWDDFSFTTGNTPLDSLWQNSNSVYVGDGIAKNPPSIGAASLDGVNAEGQGYTGGSVGATDALTSCPIDLSGLSIADDVYISFFYQYAGNGEQPEETDSIRLEVLSVTPDTTAWLPIWPTSTNQLQRTENFQQALIRLDTASLFTDQFQFRIQAFGRPVGFFDVWNIDYVYVNKDRSPTDNNYPDRTLSTPVSSIFDGLYAIPARHFENAQIANPSFVVTSVDNPGDSPQPYTFLYNLSNTIWLDGNSSKSSFSSGSLGNGLSIRAPNSSQISIDNFTTSLSFGDMDSAFISIETYIDTNDNLIGGEGDYDIRFSPIDFRWNDTTRSSFVIKDYYAYDDGTAEIAAGFSFSGNRLAIEYPFKPTISDTLVAVDMYFPLGRTDPSGKRIGIRVWDEVNGEPGEVIGGEDINILRDPVPNKFTRYVLNDPIILSDTFFLGYRQGVEGELGVGYDLSNNSNNKVFFNIADTWQQTSSTEFVGSFMIRPVFGNLPSDTLVTSLNDELAQVALYPNPTQGTFTISGDFDQVEVYNMMGKLLLQERKKKENQPFDISTAPAGIYIVRIFEGIKSRTLKVIKQ